MNEFVKTVIIKKSRKAHRCEFCSGRILEGSSYTKITFSYDGSIYTYQLHNDCHALSNEIGNHFDLFREGGIPLDEFLINLLSEQRVEYLPKLRRLKHRSCPLVRVIEGLQYEEQLQDKDKEIQELKAEIDKQIKQRINETTARNELKTSSSKTAIK